MKMIVFADPMLKRQGKEMMKSSVDEGISRECRREAYAPLEWKKRLRTTVGTWVLSNSGGVVKVPSVD